MNAHRFHWLIAMLTLVCFLLVAWSVPADAQKKQKSKTTTTTTTTKEAPKEQPKEEAKVEEENAEEVTSATCDDRFRDDAAE